MTKYWLSPSRHQKIKTVQWIWSRIWDMKGSEYAKILTKIQATAIFHMRDIRGNDLPKCFAFCMEKSCWCPGRYKSLEIQPHCITKPRALLR